MSKTTAPLLSFDARGQLANTLVYSTWRGIPYARRYVIPSNPNTTAQQSTRNTFSWLSSVWRLMPAEVREAWTAFASGQPITDRNAVVKINLPVLRGEADLANLVLSPSAKSGPVAATIGTTPGTEEIVVDLTAPTLPTGWTIVQAVAAAIRDQDPESGTLYLTTAGTDLTDPYQVTLPGLTASQLYRVGGWFKYLKPDGTNAYGPALMTSDTPTA